MPQIILYTYLITVLKLKLLTLMYTLDYCIIIMIYFFLKSLKQFSDHFNILNYVTFPVAEQDQLLLTRCFIIIHLITRFVTYILITFPDFGMSFPLSILSYASPQLNKQFISVLMENTLIQVL